MRIAAICTLSEPDWRIALSRHQPFAVDVAVLGWHHYRQKGRTRDRSNGSVGEGKGCEGRCLRNGKAAREFTARMSKPKRIQRSRAKDWKMPANAIYVGRPTVWGNPYVVGSELMNGETLTAEKAIALYEQHLADNFSERDIRHCLHGKDLACWCALDEPCHADVLLRIANSRPK